MVFDPTKDSWGPGEAPVGDADSKPPRLGPGDTIVPEGDTGSIRGSSDFEGDVHRVTSDLAGAARERFGRDSYLSDQYTQRLDQDRARMDHALQLESATANDPALTHPWNADRERADRIKGPLENFGSLGTIFALAASAFTKTPMVSALNASAAAMTAMRENDELNYKSAYQAWKDNTELVQKRFNMERAVYDDTNKLFASDVSAWRSKMAMNAAQFDNQKIMTMLDNGMDAEVFKTFESQANAMDKINKAKEDFQNFNLTNDLAKDKLNQWKEANPPPGAGASQQEQIAYGFKMRAAEHQALVDAKKQIAQSKSVSRFTGNPNQQQYDLIRQKYEGDPDAARKVADEYAQFIRNQKVSDGGAGGSAALTADRQHASDTQKIIDDEIKNGKLDGNDPKAIASRRKEIEAQYSGRPMTGNERIKLEQRVDKFKHSEDTIDKTLKVLETHPAAAGIAGKAMRLEERVSNILGSNNTARVQMMRDIELLRAWGQELLFSSRGKLKEEATRIDSIVGGTSAGDTGLNTIRALHDLRKLYTEMQSEDQARINGTWTGNTPAPPAPKSGGKAPWASDPLVGH